MIEILEMPADYIVGIKVSGKIEKDDILPLIDYMKPKFDQHSKLSVYVEVESWEGITVSALWEDLKFGLPHLKAIHKKSRSDGSTMVESGYGVGRHAVSWYQGGAFWFATKRSGHSLADGLNQVPSRPSSCDEPGLRLSLRDF